MLLSNVHQTDANAYGTGTCALSLPGFSLTECKWFFLQGLSGFVQGNRDNIADSTNNFNSTNTFYPFSFYLQKKLFREFVSNSGDIATHETGASLWHNSCKAWIGAFRNGALTQPFRWRGAPNQTLNFNLTKQ